MQLHQFLRHSQPKAKTALLPIGFFTAFAFGAGATGVVVLTPPPMRAQASAIYLLFVNLIGIGLAPYLTAFLTQYVFADHLAVGKSSAIVAGGEAVDRYGAAAKVNPDFDMFEDLFEVGRAAGLAFLRDHFWAIGVCGTLDPREELF